MKKSPSFITLFLLFSVFISVSVFADQNPIDFKQSANAWIVWTDLSENQAVIFASRWEGDKWGPKMQVSSASHYNVAPAIALNPATNQPWVVWSGHDGIKLSLIHI